MLVVFQSLPQIIDNQIFFYYFFLNNWDNIYEEMSNGFPLQCIELTTGFNIIEILFDFKAFVNCFRQFIDYIDKYSGNKTTGLQIDIWLECQI